jgi:hypothetical protein
MCAAAWHVVEIRVGSCPAQTDQQNNRGGRVAGDEDTAIVMFDRSEAKPASQH